MMDEKYTSQALKMIRRLDREELTNDPKIQLRKSELDKNLDDLYRKDPIVRSCFHMLLNHEGITEEHMFLEIITHQNEAIKRLRETLENHIAVHGSFNQVSKQP